MPYTFNLSALRLPSHGHKGYSICHNLFSILCAAMRISTRLNSSSSQAAKTKTKKVGEGGGWYRETHGSYLNTAKETNLK